ncbi:hypothetical protein [Myxococcus sp. RHSTA-1-4]|uniref:hypothetical protein n=1 Tax=Myxococcus sp. RHSTA-1-4 TaxID=2874601 RepID=UPI001CBD810F|nr:hypothetical protein [Myxococcus sp. RHSTA-1-4]MBZ4418523.1 hypothetical protein [Myxococcus sp. RHSTA-1-4]
MRDSRRTGRWLGAALVALLLTGAGEAWAKECNNCCQLPCVEAAIHTAQEMRKLYARLKDTKGLSQDAYAKAVDQERARLGSEWFASVGSLPQCQFDLPGPDDQMEIRRLMRVGWGVEHRKGDLAFNISVATDMESCSLREDQMALFKEIASCTEIAGATEVHERKHLEQCAGRKKGQKDSTKVQATHEVEAYDVELAHLRKLRQSLESACMRRSCKQDVSDKDAKALGQGLQLMRAIQGKAGR